MADVDLRSASCFNGWDWAYNSLNQDPCFVVGQLRSKCMGVAYTIYPLSGRQGYPSPQANDQNALKCDCNTVIYSMVMACTACQNGTVMPWSDWSVDCPSIWVSHPLDGTTIPYWAFLDVTIGDTWDITEALEARHTWIRHNDMSQRHLKHIKRATDLSTTDLVVPKCTLSGPGCYTPTQTSSFPLQSSSSSSTSTTTSTSASSSLKILLPFSFPPQTRVTSGVIASPTVTTVVTSSSIGTSVVTLTVTSSSLGTSVFTSTRIVTSSRISSLPNIVFSSASVRASSSSDSDPSPRAVYGSFAGGLAAIIIIGGIAWFFMHRRRRAILQTRKDPAPPEMPLYNPDDPSTFPPSVYNLSRDLTTRRTSVNYNPVSPNGKYNGAAEI